jgi:hypothetical protein
MRKLSSPSIAPNGPDRSIFLVLDRLPPDTTLFHESVLESTNLETVISDMISGQYNDPIRVLSFNPDEKWSQDVSEDVAREVQRRCDLQLRDVPHQLQDFMDAHLGQHPKQLPLFLSADHQRAS